MKFENLTAAQIDMLLELFDRSSPVMQRRIVAKLVFDRERMSNALDEAMKLQTHYAELLNNYDGGKRVGFQSGEAWMDRLEECGKGFKI
jgi:hypothetical protein